MVVPRLEAVKIEAHQQPGVVQRRRHAGALHLGLPGDTLSEI